MVRPTKERKTGTITTEGNLSVTVGTTMYYEACSWEIDVLSSISSEITTTVVIQTELRYISFKIN